MMSFILILILMICSNIIAQDKNDVQYIDLNEAKIEKNSDLFKIENTKDGQILTLKNNQFNQNLDPITGKITDYVHGKVILFGDVKHDYSMIVDMKFIETHIDLQGAGWFGFAIRAQDVNNYEIVWFMPGGAEKNNTVAHVPVAHGLVPWWSEAYATQKKGDVLIPKNDWFTARVDVKGDEFFIYVNDQFIFRKKLTYYLKYGRPGLYVGTATDVAFRRIKIKEINNKP